MEWKQATDPKGDMHYYLVHGSSAMVLAELVQDGSNQNLVSIEMMGGQKFKFYNLEKAKAWVEQKIQQPQPTPVVAPPPTMPDPPEPPATQGTAPVPEKKAASVQTGSQVEEPEVSDDNGS
jgi:hypothetical protein